MVRVERIVVSHGGTDERYPRPISAFRPSTSRTNVNLVTRECVQRAGQRISSEESATRRPLLWKFALINDKLPRSLCSLSTAVVFTISALQGDSSLQLRRKFGFYGGGNVRALRTANFEFRGLNDVFSALWFTSSSRDPHGTWHSHQCCYSIIAYR